MERVDLRDEGYLATAFRDVDGTDTTKMARCLTLLDSLPSFRQYKELMLELMSPKPGDIAADLGCGLGFDVLRLAGLVRPQGLVIGIDASNALLQSARSMCRPSLDVGFVRADVQNLPLTDGCLDLCKIDRTLQHVEKPASVLREMFRTVHSGGTIVCAEPDWSTFRIDHENETVVRQIEDLWAQSFRNPQIGRQLSDLLRETGFVNIEVQHALLLAPCFETSDGVFDIVQTASRLAEMTPDDEPRRWISYARESDRRRPVSSSVNLFLNFARRP